MTSSGEFSLSNLYLSPRVVREAQNAGILDFAVDKQHVEGIIGLVRNEFPRNAPRGSIDELAIVMRWGGRWTSRDVRLVGAAADQKYLPAVDYICRDPDSTEGYVTKTQIEVQHPEIVEMHAGPWEQGRLASRLAEGVLNFGHYQDSAVAAGISDFLRNADMEDVTRLSIIGQSQREYAQALSVLTLSDLGLARPE